MQQMQVMFYIFTGIVGVGQATPFIYDSSLKYCSYFGKSYAKDRIRVSSKIVHIKAKSGQIHFVLCGAFNDNTVCPKGTKACVENTQTGQMHSLGNEFELDNGKLTFFSGDFCTKNENRSLVIHLANTKMNSRFMYKDDCTYHVEMMHPAFTPICSVRIHDQLFDLSALTKTGPFLINYPDKNFSVSFCVPNPLCGKGDANACEIVGDLVTPISLASSLQTVYREADNLLEITGFTYKDNKINAKRDKRFEVFLKCDWNKKVIRNDDLTYVKKQIQGRRYTFNLDTSYGCVKKSTSCVIEDSFFKYNLTGLYKPEMWSVKSGNRLFFLQLCGPSALTVANVSCSNSHAQVCENVSGKDINRGSVLTHLEVLPLKDKLTATIASGSKCGEDAQYRSVIDLFCDRFEHGPKYITRDKCDTYFTWRTPHACPFYNATLCDYIQTDSKECNFELNYISYDLSAINVTQAISHPQENVRFHLNVCGPTVVESAPCLKDVEVVMENLSEPNIRKRAIQLGKLSKRTIINGSLVLQYRSGTLCPDNKDYTSDVYLVCSENQEPPFLLKKENCHYEFMWKTTHGCPLSLTNSVMQRVRARRNSCIFTDNDNKKSFDFESLIPIEVAMAPNSYVFHMCDRFYSDCNQNSGNCTNIPLKDSIFTYSNETITLEVEFCEIHHANTSLYLKRLIVIFFCHEIKHNDHISNWTRQGSTLTLNYFTNAVCAALKTNKNDKFETDNNKKQIDNDEIRELGSLKRALDCSIESPFTNQTLNVSQVQNFTDDLFNYVCPTATFNDTFRFVKLHYPGVDKCRLAPSKNISYDLYLMCGEFKVPFPEDECLQHIQRKEPEYCIFFKPPSAGTNYYLMAALVLVGLGLFIGVAAIWRHYNFRSSPTTYSSMVHYEKDVQI